MVLCLSETICSVRFLSGRQSGCFIPFRERRRALATIYYGTTFVRGLPILFPSYTVLVGRDLAMAGDSEVQIRHLLAPVPDLKGKTKPQGTDLTPDQQKAVDAVLAHFSKEDYELPGGKDGAGKLMEEEKFWLARYAKLC